MSEIVIKLPGPDEPGFLRRMHKCRQFMGGIDAATGFSDVYGAWDAIADWLVMEGYVTAPDGVDVHEAMLDMSQNDILVILWALAGIAISGKKAASAVDPPNAA